MIEVKLPNLPSKINFLTLLEALLMLNAPSVRIEIGGRYKIEVFPLGIYYQDTLRREDIFRHSEIAPILERLYSGN